MNCIDKVDESKPPSYTMVLTVLWIYHIGHIVMFLFTPTPRVVLLCFLFLSNANDVTQVLHRNTNLNIRCMPQTMEASVQQDKPDFRFCAFGVTVDDGRSIQIFHVCKRRKARIKKKLHSKLKSCLQNVTYVKV